MTELERRFYRALEQANRWRNYYDGPKWERVFMCLARAQEILNVAYASRVDEDAWPNVATTDLMGFRRRIRTELNRESED